MSSSGLRSLPRRFSLNSPNSAQRHMARNANTKRQESSVNAETLFTLCFTNMKLSPNRSEAAVEASMPMNCFEFSFLMSISIAQFDQKTYEFTANCFAELNGYTNIRQRENACICKRCLLFSIQALYGIFT